jgi:hypothetical protein
MDDLLRVLKNKTLAKRIELNGELINSALAPEDKEFLSLLLDYCVHSDTSTDITQEKLNQRADEYLKISTKPAMAEFVRKYIRYKIVASDWGFGFEFFSGYGVFSGQLQSHYKDNVPVGVAFDVIYKKFTLYLRDYIGFSFTKHDFTGSSAVWPKGSQVRVFLPEATLGYTIDNNKNYSLTPFAGISSCDIGPIENDTKTTPALKGYDLKFTTTYTFGINADIKLKKYSGYPNTGYLFIRVRYAYNMPQLSKYYPGTDGSFQYLTIGIGGIAHKPKRDY